MRINLGQEREIPEKNDIMICIKDDNKTQHKRGKTESSTFVDTKKSGWIKVDKVV